MKIFCCGCGQDIDARLTDGAEIFPYRKDLYSLPFWKCDACGNFDRILDPLWKPPDGKMTRTAESTARTHCDRLGGIE